MLKTPEAIISFPRLFTPNEKGKYEAAFIFPAGSDLEELKDAASAVAFNKFGDKAAAMLASGQLKSPFRSGSEKVHLGYPEDSTFFNARSNNQPGVVSIYPDPNNEGKPTLITDPGAVVAGARVIAAVSFFYYDVDGNKGIGVGLEHVQLRRAPTAEERLDGRVAVQDTFEADKDAVADLSDMEDSEPVGAGTSGGGDDLSDLM